MNKKKNLTLIIAILLFLFVIFNIIFLGNHSSNKENSSCEFIRTYKIEKILPSNDENYLYLTIREFQGEEVETIKIKKSLCPEIMEEEYYEFWFKPTSKIEKDTILDIYQNSIVEKITKTDRTGLNQIQEDICSNK